MQLAFLILIKLILTELGPFDFSHFDGGSTKQWSSRPQIFLIQSLF